MKELFNSGQALGREEMKRIMAGSGCDKPDTLKCADGTEKCITSCNISADDAKKECDQSSGEGITCYPDTCSTC